MLSARLFRFCGLVCLAGRLAWFTLCLEAIEKHRRAIEDNPFLYVKWKMRPSHRWAAISSSPEHTSGFSVRRPTIEITKE